MHQKKSITSTTKSNLHTTIAKDSEKGNKLSFNTVSLTHLRTVLPETSTQTTPEANKAMSDNPNDTIFLMSKIT